MLQQLNWQELTVIDGGEDESGQLPVQRSRGMQCSVSLTIAAMKKIYIFHMQICFTPNQFRKNLVTSFYLQWISIGDVDSSG